MALVDGYSRTINYLRLSVTDRCNLRCSYCMPECGVEKLPAGEVLSFEELLVITEAAVALGVEKVRVTGGEPLVRKGILPFLERLAALQGLKELVLTTNGVLLPEMAEDLRTAGVQRLNISLDSLRPEVFRSITRCGDLSRVLAGITAARACGLPVKINVVLMRGVNDEEIEAFAALTLEEAISVRFIEYMPTVGDPHWRSKVVPGAELLKRLATSYDFHPVAAGRLAGPSRDYRIAGAAGTFGLITPMSGHFCQGCNRIRVTSSGKAKGCLFSGAAYDLRPILVEGQVGVQRVLRGMVMGKPAHHVAEEITREHSFSMAGVGG